MILNEKHFRVKARIPIETFLKSIHDSRQQGKELRYGDRGEKAKLRRSSDPISALTAPTIQLVETLSGDSHIVSVDSTGLALAATLAALLASLKGTFVWGLTEQDRLKVLSLGTLAGRESTGGNASCLSRLRFGKLTKAHGPEKRLKYFRELLRLTKADDFEKIDPLSLAYLFLTWDSPGTQWSFARAYFMAGKPDSEISDDAALQEAHDSSQSA
jgi:CRISPR type I-E-associated protein CasB/Cse2